MRFQASLLIVLFLALLLNFQPDEPVNLRVMTYNIKAGQESSIEQIAGVIESHDPDIVALQEVDVHWSERSEYRNQIRFLGDALDMHSFPGEIYALPPVEGRKKMRKYGLAILSKHPFSVRENHHLTRLSSRNKDAGPIKMPGFPQVSITVGGSQVHLFNTHLDYRKDPAIRQTEVEEMLAIINRVDAPKLLVGDLNAEPANFEISNLFEVFNDAWENQAGKGEERGATFPADSPEKRIDYILYSDHFTVRKAFVVETEKSDHRPVVADFGLE